MQSPAHTEAMNTFEITYAEAICQATDQALEQDPNVIVFGQLVDSSPGVFGTTRELVDKFGPDRLFDFPISEGMMTSNALGMAIGGQRPVIVHQRLDFSLYALDALINWISL
jgi:acetoin:2,6-dichlorophenolindophenol oxidoreductase subunit beta